MSLLAKTKQRSDQFSKRQRGRMESFLSRRGGDSNGSAQQLASTAEETPHETGMGRGLLIPRPCTGRTGEAPRSDRLSNRHAPRPPPARAPTPTGRIAEGAAERHALPAPRFQRFAHLGGRPSRRAELQHLSILLSARLRPRRRGRAVASRAG